MNFSNETIEILKNFSTINPSIVFEPGNVLKTMSANRTVIGEATIKETIPTRFAIYELNKFLSAASLFENPTFNFDVKHVDISDDNQHIKYSYMEPSLITSPYTISKQFTPPTPDVSVSLTTQELLTLNKSLAILALPEAAIVGDGSKIFIKGVSSKGTTNDAYVAEIGKTDKKFSVFLKKEHLNFLPKAYTIGVSFKGLTTWQAENITYYVATEANSKYE